MKTAIVFIVVWLYVILGCGFCIWIGGAVPFTFEIGVVCALTFVLASVIAAVVTANYQEHSK